MTLIRTHLKKTASLAMVVFAFSFCYMPIAKAGLISTADIVAEQTVAEQRAAITEALAREDIREQLVVLGVDPEMVQARVAHLSDTQVHQLHGKLETLPAAGDGVIGALVFIFIVLLVTDILGLTDIFPFVTSDLEVDD